MSNLTVIARPPGQSEAYLFVEDIDTGARFKVAQAQRTSDGGQVALTFSIAPCDADGAALLDPAGNPDLAAHTHTFTAVELAAPGFDLEARAAEVIAALAEGKQREIAARASVLGLGGMWADGALDLTKRVTPPAGEG